MGKSFLIVVDVHSKWAEVVEITCEGRLISTCCVLFLSCSYLFTKVKKRRNYSIQTRKKSKNDDVKRH